jgi:DNA-binding NtrC family response regulator
MRIILRIEVNMKKILAVDDNKAECRLLELALENVRGYEVLTAASGRSALDQAVRCTPDAVILDLLLPDFSGLEVLKELKKIQPTLPVIMLTGLSDIRKVVEAIQMGADNFLTKPFENDQLLLVLRQAVEQKELLNEVAALRRKVGRMGPALSRITGKSPAIREVVGHIQKVADSNRSSIS